MKKILPFLIIGIALFLLIQKFGGQDEQPEGGEEEKQSGSGGSGPTPIVGQTKPGQSPTPIVGQTKPGIKSGPKFLGPIITKPVILTPQKRG